MHKKEIISSGFKHSLVQNVPRDGKGLIKINYAENTYSPHA